jgi:Domain of unknown function (DUF4062)
MRQISSHEIGSMADGEFRVFLSAVSSEFRSARDELTHEFGARDVLVRVQEQFVPSRQARTLLQALDDYIGRCTTVVCVIGRRSGTCPPREATSGFAHILPEGVSRASYTQWEYYLARHHGVECLLYLAQDDHDSDEAAPLGADFPDLQLDFVARIRREGLHYESFATTDELCRKVFRHHWPEGGRRHKPIVLPYPSIGTLFKGRDAFLSRLRDSFGRANGAATIAGRAVHGMGGVGKTRTAVEYAWIYRADYTALFLIDAETPDKLHTGLATLTVSLRLPAQAETNEAVRMEAGLAWLNTNPGC